MVRRLALAILFSLTVSGCGADAPPARRPMSVAAYAATTDRLCSDLALAIERAFAQAPSDPGGALARYAHSVSVAGERFSRVMPPPDLAAFHAVVSRHVRSEAAKLLRVAARTKAGDARAQVRALRDHQGLLPRAIPATLLAYAPTCRALSPPEPVPGAPA